MKKNKVTVIKNKPVPIVKEDFYYIEGVDSFHDFDDQVCIYKSKDQIYDVPLFEMQAGTTQHTCGLIELGQIKLNTRTVDQKLKDTLVKAVQKLVSIHTNDGRTGTKSITIMANLINNSGCNLLREALEKSGLFVKVKSWKNINSGNIIDMYLSTN